MSSTNQQFIELKPEYSKPLKLLIEKQLTTISELKKMNNNEY